MGFQLPAIRNKFLLNKSYVKMLVSTRSYISTSLPLEQAAIMLSVVRILQKEHLILCIVEESVANTCI